MQRAASEQTACLAIRGVAGSFTDTTTAGQLKRFYRAILE